MNKNIIVSLMLVLIIGLLFASCCGDDDLPSASVGVAFDIYSGTSEYTIESALIGMNASLRNDEISSEILSITKSMLAGDIAFYLHDGDFANENYPGVNLETEVDTWRDGSSTFYIIVNDPEVEDYDSNYVTKKLTFVELEAMGENPKICINKK